jgi:DNA-binding MarR family transcriptional regulator
VDQVNNLRCRELVVLLRKITQALDLHSKHLNKNFGLTGPQLIILQELVNGEITVSELARRVSLSQGTVTDIIHRLENKHLIIKRRSDQDKRRVMITLSEECRHILDLAPPPLQEAFADSFTQLEEWEQLMILSSMNKIVKMMSVEKKDASAIRVSNPVKMTS